MFNPWGQVWWQVYASTFIFIILSFIIGFLTLCILALMLDKQKPPAGKQKGLKKKPSTIIPKKGGNKNGIKRNA